VDDRDLAVRITRRIRAWLPALLAMSASSPFFQGEHLIDPRSIRPVPATDVVRALLVHVRAALEELGDWEAVAQLSEALLAHGPSARRQRVALSQGQSLAAMVAGLAAETAAG
jgi:gamma-glutamyl:cysteine ligase YbdK (ATP-grasp superfamily)